MKDVQCNCWRGSYDKFRASLQLTAYDIRPLCTNVHIKTAKYYLRSFARSKKSHSIIIQSFDHCILVSNTEKMWNITSCYSHRLFCVRIYGTNTNPCYRDWDTPSKKCNQQIVFTWLSALCLYQGRQNAHNLYQHENFSWTLHD